MKITFILVLQASVFLATAQAAPALDEPDVMGRSMMGDETFKLHVERFGMHDLPNFELKDWPQKPHVDEGIVNQIDAVKTANPEWHGLHHMVPGTGSTKN